jgi:hypothetical protein
MFSKMAICIYLLSDWKRRKSKFRRKKNQAKIGGEQKHLATISLLFTVKEGLENFLFLLIDYFVNNFQKKVYF